MPNCLVNMEVKLTQVSMLKNVFQEKVSSMKC